LYYWYFLLVLASAASLHRLYKLYFAPKNYVVTATKKETHAVKTIYLTPLGGKVMDYKPGQFAFVRFFSNGLPREEHHFTLSSAPDDKDISFTIKDSGDYTSQVGKIKKGDKARVDGPYGVFSNHGLSGPFLFIAGGIGITPVISMLKNMDKKTRDTVLIYANREPKDMAFKTELSRLAAKKLIKLVLVFSQKKGTVKEAYQAYIDAEIIDKEVADIKTRKIFLVGPVPMMDSVEKDLLALGVQKSNIFTERFALKD